MPENPHNALNRRIPALDGWRGIAILLVLVDHLQAQWHNGYFPFLQTGQHGVTLFFVLSGFLITRNLLQTPSLQSFYIRRFFRLMPVAWSYLAFIILLGTRLPSVAPTSGDILSCVFFVRNYVGHQSPFLPSGHFWSLSIEGQFYLIWPLLLVTLSRRNAGLFAALAAAGCAIFRLLHWHVYNRQWMSFHSEVRIDAICIGCLLAIGLQNENFRRIATKLAPRLQIPAVCAFGLLIAFTSWLPLSIESIVIAVLLACTILAPQCWISRLFSAGPLITIGRISYSLYVWQQFFLVHYDTTINALLDLLAPICCLSVYNLIEKPMNNLGYRLVRNRRQSFPPEKVS